MLRSWKHALELRIPLRSSFALKVLSGIIVEELLRVSAAQRRVRVVALMRLGFESRNQQSLEGSVSKRSSGMVFDGYRRPRLVLKLHPLVESMTHHVELDSKQTRNLQTESNPI